MRLKPELIDDYMTHARAQIKEEATIKEALHLMKALKTELLVVTKNGKPAYVINDHNIFLERMDAKIEEIDRGLLEPAYLVRSGTMLAQSYGALKERKVIVVVDEQDRMIGIVTLMTLSEKI